MRKIDKTLKEVRAIKKKISVKTAKMSVREAVAYFRSAKGLLPPPRKGRVA